MHSFANTGEKEKTNLEKEREREREQLLGVTFFPLKLINTVHFY